MTTLCPLVTLVQGLLEAHITWNIYRRVKSDLVCVFRNPQKFLAACIVVDYMLLCSAEP